MKPKDSARIALAALAIIALAAKQERERLFDWFNYQPWYTKALVACVLILFFTLALKFTFKG